MQRPLRAFLSLIAGLAVPGAVLAADLLGRGAPIGSPGQRRPGGPAMAQTVPTSFGLLAVERVERLTGLTGRDLGGMTQGIQGLVPAERVRIQALVSLNNRLARPIEYAPSQFRLIAGADEPPIAASTASLPTGRLLPQARVAGTLGFVAPGDAPAYRLEFREPNAGQPVVVDLGPLYSPGGGGPDRGPNGRESDHVPEHRVPS